MVQSEGSPSFNRPPLETAVGCMMDRPQGVGETAAHGWGVSWEPSLKGKGNCSRNNFISLKYFSKSLLFLKIIVGGYFQEGILRNLGQTK